MAPGQVSAAVWTATGTEGQAADYRKGHRVGANTEPAVRHWNATQGSTIVARGVHEEVGSYIKNHRINCSIPPPRILWLGLAVFKFQAFFFIFLSTFLKLSMDNCTFDNS